MGYALPGFTPKRRAAVRGRRSFVASALNVQSFFREERFWARFAFSSGCAPECFCSVARYFVFSTIIYVHYAKHGICFPFFYTPHANELLNSN